MSDDARTPGGHAARKPEWGKPGNMASWRRGVVASLFWLFACATGGARVPDSLKGYEIVLSRRDTLSQALVGALREHGFAVRRDVRGGGRPAAGLVHFIFREPETAEVAWLHVRLFDTRSGVILAVVVMRLDSIGPGSQARARAVVDSLVAALATGSFQTPDR